MRTRTRNPFTTVTTSGLLLPVDLLSRVVDGDTNLPGISSKDYHLRSGERTNEVAARAWNECLSAWKSFRKKFAALPASDAGTTLTRDEWLLPLFGELGYGRLQTKKAIEIEDREYPISHGWENHVPIHLLSARYPLDRRIPGVPGAATRSPYSLMQELLNCSAAHRWGFVSNGLKLFLLRDNAALARAANVEFDLEGMFDGEVYADFMLFYLLCHQSRVEISPDGKPEDCWLEKWASQAEQQGTRAREKLRDGVEAAIKSLGAGLLTTRGNQALRDRLRSGNLAMQDYYRQLLRLVYRLLMLLVAEEKKTESGDNLLHPPETPPEVRERYARFYSVSRIRTLADNRRGTAHADLYESLKVLFVKLREGYAPLGIPGFGSFLFSETATPDLDDAALANQDLLDALRHLCYTDDTSGRGGSVRRPVDFGNLGSEELGSVYESLLELHPRLDTEEGPFTLRTAAGHERKTTGSYYTPRSLINCLLDSALDPVVTEAIDVPDPKEAEKKLLDLKVCDPACGSGHFLIAAAERMATHLARLRTGDDQPGTLDVQHAKRDIIGRCIYGVDVNPMAVELCKVSLWMEALQPGKALSFLDHHIQCGNSLLGTTPKLLADGIPDAAFKPIEGDDKKVCAALKKDNKRERKDYAAGYRDFYVAWELGNLPTDFAKLTASMDESVADIAEKERRYAELVSGADYQNACLLADTWCAVFVWQKDTSDLGRLCPTERDFRNIGNNPHSSLPQVKSEVRRLADQYQFFHWHLAFPDVFRLPGEGQVGNEQTGWDAGFNVVLGNPPWERIKLLEREWFAERVPEIAAATNSTARKKLISDLKAEDVETYAAFLDDKRFTEGTSELVRSSGQYPLTGRGDVNTYQLFAELNRCLLSQSGRVGCIVPSGIATDDTTKLFFNDLMDSNSLVTLYDFENRGGLFPDIDSRMKFCLLTMAGAKSRSDGAKFVFFAHQPQELTESWRQFYLTSKDIDLLNPTTRTCPVFRSGRDATLLATIHREIPTLWHQSQQGDGWQLDIFQKMIDVTIHADLCSFTASPPDTDWLPLYEGRTLRHYNHRATTYDGVPDADRSRGQPREPSVAELNDPSSLFVPSVWVSPQTFRDRIGERAPAGRWFPSLRYVTNTTNERTVIGGIRPFVPSNNKLSTLFIQATASEQACFISNFSSYIFDYIARQKVGGTTFGAYIVEQLPAMPRSRYAVNLAWSRSSAEQFILSRVLELTYTAWDLEPFARDCGYDGPPFRWDDDRRFLWRCELDAAYFHLYLGSPSEWGADSPQLREMLPTPRDAVDYIMDTFPIVRRKDEQAHGEYRTKRVILEIYDEMAEAIRTGHPFQTRLTPLPGPPTDADGNFIPMSQWDPAHWPEHIHPPRKEG